MKIENVGKLVANLHDKTEQAWNHEFVFKKVHSVIKFNQNAWLKPYIDVNKGLRKKTKDDFEKDFFKWMNNE